MAGGVITTGAHPKALWPGVRKFQGADYKSMPAVWSKIYALVHSEKAYEEDVMMTTFGLAAKKPEGQPLSYDSHSQEWTRRHTHDTYALGYVVTEEEIEDNLYASKSFKRASFLNRSMLETKEINAANLLVYAFTAGYTGGDGVVMVSASHPTASGNQSNILSTGANLSEKAMEDLLIQMWDAKNSRGIRAPRRGHALIIRHDLKYEAHRILKSILRVGTANNDPNAIKDMGELSEIIIEPYMTSKTAWFIQSDLPKDEGLVCFERRALKFQQDNDFDTANAKAKCSERYVFDWTDWRCIYGSAGA
jgi:hypothetical protein